jgi:hypothetical protein
MRPKTVNSTQSTVAIHPYVQGRLRAIPRQEESAGILLGSSENGVTHITGFKRVQPNALRQAAQAAGPALAGFFRLQTPDAPALRASEIELCRQTQPLFLLLNAVNGAASDALVCRPTTDGQATSEALSLMAPPTPVTTQVPRVRTASPRLPWLAVGLILALAGAAYYLRTVNPPPGLALDVQSRSGELAAIWQQSGILAQPLQSAALTIQDGESEQTMDLTPTFTAQGRAVLHPRTSTIIVTLNVQYAGGLRLSRSTTYVGFDPVIAQPQPQPQDNGLRAEVVNLRRRNKELLDAVTAMRKHFDQ